MSEELDIDIKPAEPDQRVEIPLSLLRSGIRTGTSVQALVDALIDASSKHDYETKDTRTILITIKNDLQERN